MTILKKNIFVLMGTLITLVLASCGNASENDWPTDGSVKFFYENKEITPTYGEKNNVETYDYDSLKVHNTTNTLRDDFAYGVDASMVYEVEKHAFESSNTQLAPLTSGANGSSVSSIAQGSSNGSEEASGSSASGEVGDGLPDYFDPWSLLQFDRG